MKTLPTLLAALLGITLPIMAQTNEQPQSLIAPGAKLEKLSGEFQFAEGATCDSSGNVFFTDQPNDRILKWSVDGKLSTFKQPAGRANGMCFDAKGNLFACADEKNELWSITPDGAVTVVWKDYEGKLLNGPNDVALLLDGSLFLTDPFYKRPWWKHSERPQDTEQVYFLSADHKNLKRVTNDFTKPNGILASADGKTLFVSDIGASKTYSFKVQPDGSLTDKQLRAAMGSDGMTLDTEGNLYLTGRGVFILAPNGKQLEHIPVPESWVGNICFGGKNHDTLFIAASKGLYSVRMKTKGANPAK